MKFKKLILAVSLSAGFICAENISAAIEVADSYHCRSTIAFNSPSPNKTFLPGEVIKFSGRYRVASCGDGLFFNKVVFYVAQDLDIPFKTCASNCNCFGASSITYPTCTTDGAPFPYESSVEFLNLSAGQKVYKLGEAYPADVSNYGGEGGHNWIGYNYSFVIPENIDISGPVRFYVQASGSHWNAHWHWNITYQNGNLSALPMVKTLKVSQPNYCDVASPTGMFTWAFGSLNGAAAQASYKVQVATNQGFNSLAYESPQISSPNGSFATPAGALEYGKTYYWRVKITDTYGSESLWTPGPSFTTPNQAAPRPDFGNQPKKIVAGEKAIFNSLPSYCYSGSTRIACQDDTENQYLWDFGNGETSTDANPEMTFEQQASYTIKLSITSNSSDPRITCSATKTIGVGRKIPGWQELAP